MGIFSSGVKTPWRSTSLSHTGLGRGHNEDRILEMADQGVWAVADGMGGHDCGEQASHIVVECLRSESGTGDDLTASFLKAHRHIRRHAGDSKMGSTAVALRIQSTSLNYEVAWVGDSRAYLLRGREFLPLTRDHTLVNEMVTKGMISAQEAAEHPERGVLSRAIGRTEESKLTIDRKLGQCRRRDTFLLCSDGLHGVVPDDELHAGLRGMGSPIYKAHRLLDLAMRAGAPDNISLILVQL